LKIIFERGGGGKGSRVCGKKYAKVEREKGEIIGGEEKFVPELSVTCAIS
jgi:hypothetical protein